MSELALRGRWEGFAGSDCPIESGRRRLYVSADYAGPDDDPTPLLVIVQSSNSERGPELVDLTLHELRWLVEEVAPNALKRMGERP